MFFPSRIQQTGVQDHPRHLGMVRPSGNRRKIGIWKGMLIRFSWDVNNVSRIWGYFGMGIGFWDAGI